MSIVERIGILCGEKKLTITGLERELGFSRGSIPKWDLNTPSVDKVGEVADYFDVSIDYLKGRVEDRNGEIPVALSIPKGYDKLTDEEREQIERIIDMFANRH